jgi:osmotically-inducible protein OsmY
VRHVLAVIAVLAALPSQIACSPIGAAVGAGASVGVAAAEERGVQGAASDLGVKTGVVERWFSHDHTLPTKLTATVYEGRVMITGAIADQAMRDTAIRLAWQSDAVKDVIDEIEQIVSGVTVFTHDTWIAN